MRTIRLAGLTFVFLLVLAFESGCGGLSDTTYAPLGNPGAQPQTTPVERVADQVPDVPQYTPDGYDSQAQYDAWWRSSCGPATLTAILRAYGAKTRIGIILDLMLLTHGIDQSGLHGPHAFIPVVKDYYGGLRVIPFGQDEPGLSYSHLKRIVDAGIPVAVDLWDQYGTYFPLQPGHWLVVVKITTDHVIVRDSSTLHLDNQITVSVFQKIWTHVAAVVLRNKEKLP